MTWRALKPKNSMTPCGCETDNELLENEHIEKSKDQSSSDYGREHHYLIGETPKTWCMTHRCKRPCECDEPKKSTKKSVPTPKSKKKAKR